MLRLPLPVLIAAGVVLIPANLIASAELAHAWGRRAAVVVDTPEPPENVGFIGHQDWAKVGGAYVIIAKRGHRIVLVFGNPNGETLNWRGEIFLANSTEGNPLSRSRTFGRTRTMAPQVVAYVGSKVITLLAEVEP